MSKMTIFTTNDNYCNDKCSKFISIKGSINYLFLNIIIFNVISTCFHLTHIQQNKFEFSCLHFVFIFISIETPIMLLLLIKLVNNVGNIYCHIKTKNIKLIQLATNLIILYVCKTKTSYRYHINEITKINNSHKPNILSKILNYLKLCHIITVDYLIISQLIDPFISSELNLFLIMLIYKISYILQLILISDWDFDNRVKCILIETKKASAKF
ncbi:hypothetical protein AGLY_015463 [Aphis glycines]|uniref:Uncharacterized protein n=1 Tax=Aphis glycines TaxID=307491 RepID=A0A6G0T119_APHGL|nr:hypothetical protein AGLY_015463 [Aphis glycines]